jgi:hypothetical protein
MALTYDNEPYTFLLGFCGSLSSGPDRSIVSLDTTLWPFYDLLVSNLIDLGLR